MTAKKKRKCRFVNEDALETLDLGDGDWVKVPQKVSYETLEQIAETGGTEIAMARQMLQLTVREWNFVDEEGKEVPVTDETIRKLDIPTIKAIVEVLNDKVRLDPKG